MQKNFLPWNLMKGKPSTLWAYTWGYNECRIGSFQLFYFYLFILYLVLAFILKTIDYFIGFSW